MFDYNLGRMRHDWLSEALSLRYPILKDYLRVVNPGLQGRIEIPENVMLEN